MYFLSINTICGNEQFMKISNNLGGAEGLF